MFFDKFKLNNKIALITGGAKGIGLSIAHALGEAGAKLVVIDREKSKGMRLDIPSGTAVRFEPGQSQDVELIPITGNRKIFGFNKKVMGQL